MSEPGDIEIGPITMGQTMTVMAASLRATIGTFIKPGDSEEDKSKLAVICFSIFLHQYIAPAIRPDLYAKVLQCMIDEITMETNREKIDAEPR